MTASQKFSSFTWILGFFGIWGLGKESLRFSFLTLPCTNPQGFWGCFLNISSTLLLSTLEASYHTPLFFSFLLFFCVKPQLVTNLQWITQNADSPVVFEALYGTHLQPVVLFFFLKMHSILSLERNIWTTGGNLLSGVLLFGKLWLYFLCLTLPINALQLANLNPERVGSLRPVITPKPNLQSGATLAYGPYIKHCFLCVFQKVLISTVKKTHQFHFSPDFLQSSFTLRIRNW